MNPLASVRRALAQELAIGGAQTRLDETMTSPFRTPTGWSLQLAFALHAIHLFIRDAKKLGESARTIPCRGTERTRDANRYRDSKTIDHDADGALLDPGSEVPELVATQSSDEVATSTNGLSPPIGQCSQQLVTRLVSVSVIDFLEVVDIEDDERERHHGSLRPLEFLFRSAIPGATIRQ